MVRFGGILPPKQYFPTSPNFQGKKSGAKSVNPAEAYRRQQKAKDIAKGKKERQFTREAFSQKEDPESLKAQLKEVIDLEASGEMTTALRMKKKALQQAFDAAVKNKMAQQAQMKRPPPSTIRRPEDSIYFHPTLNPAGLPPPGKPQQYRDEIEGPNSIIKATARTTGTLALPAPQGVPPSAGAVKLPAPPKAPPLPAGPRPTPKPLPPPPGPPPSILRPLPPIPPSGRQANGSPLPPPPGPPPSILRPLPPNPPSGPPCHVVVVPSGNRLPPPRVAPPVPKGGPTISATATVVQLPRATEDKKVTSMVPTALRMKREEIDRVSKRSPAATAGFGLVPRGVANTASVPTLQNDDDGGDDDDVDAFLSSMKHEGLL